MLFPQSLEARPFRLRGRLQNGRKTQNLPAGWNLIKRVLRLDDPLLANGRHDGRGGHARDRLENLHNWPGELY